jgi:hypothetical protein
MAQQMQTRQRQATPERWQRALQRALFAGVEAKQLAGSGEWIVASASRPGIAYKTDGVSCDCEAAMLGGDPVCLHRAAYWHARGVLDLDPEPEPPALGAPSCWACSGGGVVYVRDCERAGWPYSTCDVCGGSGVAALSVQAAALVAAAAAGACDHCGGPLYADAETDTALQTLCGACVEADRAAALATQRDALSAAHWQHVAERALLAA